MVHGVYFIFITYECFHANNLNRKSDAIQTITLLRDLTNVNPHWAQHEQNKELDRDLVQSYSHFQSLFEQRHGKASIVPCPPRNTTLHKRVGNITPCSWYTLLRFSNFRASLIDSMVELVWDYSFSERENSKLVFNVFRDGRSIALVTEAGYQDFDVQSHRTYCYTVKCGSIQSDEKVITVQGLGYSHNVISQRNFCNKDFGRAKKDLHPNGPHRFLQHSTPVIREDSTTVYSSTQQRKRITLDIVNYRYLDNSFGEVLTERMKRSGIDAQINKFPDIGILRQDRSTSNAVLHVSIVVGAPNLFDYTHIVTSLRTHSSTKSVIHMVLVNLRVRQGAEWEYWNLQKQEFPSGVCLGQANERKLVIYLAVFKSEADLMCIDMDQYREKNEEQLKLLEELLQPICME